jgi:hypothetical protein
LRNEPEIELRCCEGSGKRARCSWHEELPTIHGMLQIFNRC